MKRYAKIAVCLIGGLVVGNALKADVLSSTNNPLPNDPYASIVSRNMFGLNPPLPPPDPALEADKNLPKITPSGIYSVFGRWKVLFKVSGVVKPGQGPKDMFYDLAEGQREDDFEVIHIDSEKGMVTFKNHDVEQELPLEATTATSTAPTSGGRPNPGGGGPRFGQNGSGGLPVGGFGHFGGRGVPAGVNPGGNNDNLNGTPPSGANGGLNFAGSSASSGSGSANQLSQTLHSMTPEEQAAAMIVQKEAYKEEGNPASLLYPPIPGDPNGD